MKLPILVVLFNPDIHRTERYEPLNFLLAYEATEPLPGLDIEDVDQQRNVRKVCPRWTTLLSFRNRWRLQVGHASQDWKASKSPPVLSRQSIVSHVSNWTPKKGGFCVDRHPLSLIFAGPSRNGKTELAHWLAELMNKQGRLWKPF
jgi:ATP-dependent Clp protease ATP-binding subunit ClpA